MRYLIKAVQFIFSIYAFVLFLAFMILIMPVVLVASFFGKMRGGNIIYSLCRFWSDGWLFCCGIIHKNEDAATHDSGRQYIFVANHISFLDIPVIFKSIRRQKIRILGKYEMSKIPVFGFIYRNVVVLVNRENAASRAKSVRQLTSVIRKGISVFIFPEGTFNMTGQPLKEFYDGAFRIAIETETPVKPILFLDTYDRLHYSSIFSFTPGKSRAVFLPEIPVAGLTVKDVPALRQKVYDVMREALLTYKASWIGKGTAAAVNPGSS
jgi:1-acyl-sn-glycerol-3-phosphate acyltransferase